MVSARPAGRAAAALAAAAWALGCRGLVDPPLPAEARAFTPPPEYARWWAMTEACAGVTGDLAAVTWYVAPFGAVRARGEPVSGYYSRAGHRIVLAGTAAADGGTVRHEMLHALLRGGGHPRSAFVERCDGVVPCDSACLADDPAAWARARTAAAAARPVAAADLEVAVAVDPASPGAGEDRGAFRLVVSARNPRPYAVVLSFPPDSVLRRGPGYKWDVWADAGGGASGGAVVASADERVFGPGQTRRMVFDFVTGPAVRPERVPPGTVALRPGTYTFTGSLDGRAASAAGVVLRP